jgi:hypothetical protein
VRGSGELPAGRGDVASAREADSRRDTRPVELRLERSDRIARRAVGLRFSQLRSQSDRVGSRESTTGRSGGLQDERRIWSRTLSPQVEKPIGEQHTL